MTRSASVPGAGWRVSMSSSLFIHSSLLGHYSALGGVLNLLVWISFLLLTTCRFDLFFALSPRFSLSLPPALRAGIFTVRYVPFVEHRDSLSYTSIVILLAGRGILESIYCFSSTHGAFSRVGDRIDLLRSFQHSSVSRSPF